MRLTLRVMGLEVLDVELSTDDDGDDVARDLSGGSLGSDRVEVEPRDLHMGFTNGREDD